MTKEKAAMHKQTIRVVYPAGDAKIVLRTEQNWDANIEPVGQNDCVSKFAIETERPYFYFKPVLLRVNTAQWSRGENFLAVATSGAPLDIHPYFIEDTRCSVCEVMPPLASAAGREHWFRVFLPPGYHENTLKKYPVLYMHDGQNLFLKEEAFLGNTWRTDEVLGVLDRMNAIEEVIVVGIYPNERMTEYTSPGYEDYGRFLVGPADNYEPTRSMRDRLIWKGYCPGSELFYLAFPEAKHDENAWAARSPIPFQFLFGKLPAFG